MATSKLILKTVVIIVATVFGFGFTILLQRFAVVLLAIALGVLIVAM